MNGYSSNVPKHTLDALDRYWTHGYQPGSFLTMLLCGKVFDAVNRADHMNKEALGHIVYYIVHFAPRGSYGSEELVQDWINKGEMFQWHEKNRIVEYLSTDA